jgi:hypothetical protein
MVDRETQIYQHIWKALKECYGLGYWVFMRTAGIGNPDQFALMQPRSVVTHVTENSSVAG